MLFLQLFIFNLQYAIIEFPAENNVTAVVPTKWTFIDHHNELQCYWFPPKWNAPRRTEAVMKLFSISEEFELLKDPVIILSTHGK